MDVITISFKYSLLCVKITIKTIVDQRLPDVIAGFNGDLFLKLNPPFPKVRLVRFDGCKAGDIVSLELNFLLFRQMWTSEITEDKETPEEFYFIDKGVQLPFFFKSWQHKHILRVKNDNTLVVDAISYHTPTRITDWLMYPLLYLQFLYRKPIYRKVFRVRVP
jgi:ligand-binding SRPBCC domain-containing protein